MAVMPVTIASARRGVEAGAVAYPSRRRSTIAVKRGARATAVAGYAGVVNPATRPLPGDALGFTGDPEDPSAVLLPARGRLPSVGTIFLGGSSAALPRGLISKVTGVKRRGAKYVVDLAAVPITDAVPSLEYEGSLAFQPVERSGSARIADALAHASSACSPPKLLKFGAHLDSFEVRQASLGAWPPQMRLTLAIRTTESMGLAAAAAGVNCDWSLAELGPYQAAIPVGPLVVPVYATLPIKAGVHINGRLDAATINVASTTVASTAAGFDDNHATLSQQGSNVWTSGVLSLSGSAKLSASIAVQAGVGVAKGANVHVNAGFGPDFEWSSGHSCSVHVDLGSLSAGVTVLGKSLNTPGWTPIRPQLWSGCQSPAPPTPVGGEGGGTTGTTPPRGSGIISVTNAVSVGGADFYSCARLSDGGVACWGGGDSQGEFGDGGHGLNGPVRVSGITSARSLAVGEASSCAVMAGGTIRCWGWNPFGVIGDGTTTDAQTPAQVVGIGDAVGVAVGESHACAVLAGGTVSCWGRNWRGELGDGTISGPETCGEYSCSRTPVAVDGITTATAVAAGGDQSCALLADGHVDCWGEMDFMGGSSSPVEVAGIVDAVSITAGFYQACALLATGHVVCWGVGSGGGLGNGSTSNSATPVEVSGISTATQVSTGDDHSCAVLAGGTVRCWGTAFEGGLGIGTEDGPESCGSWGPCATVPVTVTGISDAVGVGSGIWHTCAVLASGRVMCWGKENGWVGEPNQPNALVPVLVP
jgi:hypothetical protein